MRPAFMLLLVLGCGLVVGCTMDQERKPVPPQGSDVGSIPWNAPRPGEGQGAFGGVFDRQ